MTNTLLTRLQNGVLALGLAMLFFSCSKEETFEPANLDLEAGESISLTFRSKADGRANFRIKEGVTACAEQTVDLIVGQKAGLGEVSIYKDANTLYVT